MFSSLDGDVAIKYKIDVEYTTARKVLLQPNADTATNYTNQRLYNNSGTIGAANYALTSLSNGTLGHNHSYVLNAESGVERLMTGGSANQGAAFQQSDLGAWWSNTASNITLYKIIVPTETGDVYPFTLISGGNEDFSADDFSAGTTHTISGDSIKMLKIEGLLSNASGDIEIRMQLNSDTTSNYPEQLLKGDTAATSAAASTRAYIVLAKLQNAKQAEFTHYLYTESGENRVGLTECSYDENALEKLAQHWSNSADPITTVKIYASSSNAITGNIKVSRLI